MDRRTFLLIALVLAGCAGERQTSTCNLLGKSNHLVGQDLVLKAVILQGADGGAYAITEQVCEKFGMLSIWQAKRPWSDDVQAFEAALVTARGNSTVEGPLGVEATIKGQLVYGSGALTDSLGFRPTHVIGHRIVSARREYERQHAEFERWARQQSQ